MAASYFTASTTGHCEHPQFHGPLPENHHVCQGEGAGHTHHHQHYLQHHQAGVAIRPRQRRALTISLLISLFMMLVESVVGWVSGSLMLLSDAIHMLSHVLAIGVGLLALRLAAQPCGEHLPFGLYRLEVLGALLNGLGLAGFSGWIIYEGVERLVNPVTISGNEIALVAGLGLVVNLVSVVVLHRAGVEDLNTKGTWYHLLADALSSVIVLIGALVFLQTGWAAIDPILSILVALLIGRWAFGLLHEAMSILLERKPEHIDLTELKRHLNDDFPEIRHIHDLHVWEITTHYICLSAHVVIEDRQLSETHQLRTMIAARLRQHFGIGHAVIQFESCSPPFTSYAETADPE